MKHTFRKQHFSSLSNACLLLVLGATFLFGACADDDLANEQPGKHTGTTVAFNVSDAQMETLAQASAKGITRGLSPQPLSSADLAPRKLEATGSNSHDFCLIESTVEGINPVKPAEGTRAEIIKTANLGNFSSIGYRAASSTAAANPSTALLWFHGEKTNPDGTLNHRYDWDWPVNVYGRFYAVYPEATPANKITLSPSNYAQVPYIDFEVNQDVKQQKDLMTACSGEVHYEHGNDPTSNLKFTHALAAVKFSIGSNLSPVIIKKIEVSGVKYKGRYELPNALNAMGNWTSVDNATTTVTLDGINMNAAEMPNTMLAGALNPATNPNNRAGRDAYTFLMIPQTLPNKSDANHAKVTIYYEEGGSTKHISFPLTGEWKANTTSEYKLSQKNSSWGYIFTLAKENKTFDYQGNETNSEAAFEVTSYRQAPDGTKQPVAWKVTKYEEWDYTTNNWVTRAAKPAWLGNIADQGTGVAGGAESVNTSVEAATSTDGLKEYNDVLKNATPKGTAANPYNLANPSGDGAKSHIEETANCYLISAPGYYCIPLVYGNAIKGGTTNSHAYQTSASGTYVLQHFKDHAGVDIASPYINVQNASDPATQASIVWTDQSGIIEASSLGIEGSGTNAFVHFRVPQDKIKNGNAVIAVKNASGTVMWSWHLWFDHSDVLNTVPCTNYQGKVYKFTKRNLGFAYLKWEYSTYDKVRMARMKVEQTIANGGVKQSAYITIRQNPRSVKEISSTLYQWGRKDAFPGTDTTPDGSFNKNGGDNMSIQNGIQHPETFYIGGTSWSNGYNQYNLWSMNNITGGFNDNAVVKTIYDPCPAGFHMAASNAFTGFTTNGQNGGSINASGAWDYGYNFNNKITSPDATVYFPASGYRSVYNGSLLSVGSAGISWVAVPNGTANGCYLLFLSGSVYPQYFNNRANGNSVRPVAEPKTRVTPKTPGSSVEAWQEEELDGGHGRQQ